MAISATLQIGESGGGITAFLAKNLKDIYTVLNLDYTIERTCDKTGRPSGAASISFIKVTIRAAKQMGAPFHAWINGEDTLMDGVIKIYDSTGIISSTMQDVTGTDPLVDVGNTMFGLPEDMMEGAMNQAMDQASNYDTREHDLYDELEHKDLLEQADDYKIKVMANDSDDVIKDKLRKTKKELDTLDTNDEALRAFIKEHPEVGWPTKEKETAEMNLDALKKYATDNKLNDAPKKKDNETDEEYLKRYRAYVKDDMEFKAAKQMVKDRPDKVKKAVVADVEQQIKNEEVLAPAYQTADKLKKQTASTAKGIAKEFVKRTMECARSITFENAYCVSLKEHFTNKPDAQGKLDATYPWTLEIGFKPKKVTITGEQLGPAAIGGSVDFLLY